MVALSPSFVLLALLTLSNAAAVPRPTAADRQGVDVTVQRPLKSNSQRRPTVVIDARSPSKGKGRPPSASKAKAQVLPLPASMARKGAKVASVLPNSASKHVTGVHLDASVENVSVESHDEHKSKHKHKSHGKHNKRQKNRLVYEESPSVRAHAHEEHRAASVYASTSRVNPQQDRRLDSRLFRYVDNDDDGTYDEEPLLSATVLVGVLPVESQQATLPAEPEQLQPQRRRLDSRLYLGLLNGDGDPDTVTPEDQYDPFLSVQLGTLSTNSEEGQLPPQLEERSHGRKHGHHHHDHHKRFRVGLGLVQGFPAIRNASTTVSGALAAATVNPSEILVSPSPLPSSSAPVVIANIPEPVQTIVYVTTTAPSTVTAAPLLGLQLNLREQGKTSGEGIVQRSHDRVMVVPEVFYIDHDRHVHFRHGWSHAHKRDDLPEPDPSSLPLLEDGPGHCPALDDAPKGFLQLMAPTADSETGEVLSQLALVETPRVGSQFVLDASDTNRTDVYLVATDEKDESGNPLVNLIAHMFDAVDAGLICLCTTSNQDPDADRALTMEPCTGDKSAVNASQVFSYDPTSSVLTPLRNAGAPSKRSTPPAGMYVAQDGPSENVAAAVNAGAVPTTSTSTLDAEDANGPPMALVFSPLTDNILPGSAAKSFGALDEPEVKDPSVSTTTTEEPSATEDPTASPSDSAEPSCVPTDGDDEPDATSTEDAMPTDEPAPEDSAADAMPTDVGAEGMDDFESSSPATATASETISTATSTGRDSASASSSTATASMASMNNRSLQPMPPLPYQLTFLKENA